MLRGTPLTKLLLAAVLVAGAATAATAEPDPPGGGPCHVYWRPPIADHNIPGVPGLPGQPYLYCDY